MFMTGSLLYPELALRRSPFIRDAVEPATDYLDRVQARNRIQVGLYRTLYSWPEG